MMFREMKPPKILYHYTDQHGLMGILDHKALWASHLFYQNDASEFVYGKNVFYKLIKETFPKRFKNCPTNYTDSINQWIALYNNPVFTISFSESEKSLNQFRGYSKTKSGFSIGFDVTKIKTDCTANNFQCHPGICNFVSVK